MWYLAIKWLNRRHQRHLYLYAFHRRVCLELLVTLSLRLAEQHGWLLLLIVWFKMREFNGYRFFRVCLVLKFFFVKSHLGLVFFNWRGFLLSTNLRFVLGRVSWVLIRCLVLLFRTRLTVLSEHVEMLNLCLWCNSCWYRVIFHSYKFQVNCQSHVLLFGYTYFGRPVRE